MILGKTRSNPKYLLDSLIYLAESQAPYIHVILSYVVSILQSAISKNTTVHYQFAVSIISFAQ